MEVESKDVCTGRVEDGTRQTRSGGTWYPIPLPNGTQREE